MPVLLVINFITIVVMTGHLMNCPFSKVEESFNLQAIHDTVYHKTNVTNYDHLQFPGVVPRSFIGPLVIGGISFPIGRLMEILDVPKIYMQFVSRFVLGLLVCVSFMKFQASINKYVNPTVARLSSVLMLTQFHFMFYASRTLPNIFALFLVLLAVSAWISKKNAKFIWYSALAILIFRAELCIFMGLLLLVKLMERQIGVLELLKHGIAVTFCALGATILIDSFFWQRWLWPEGEVLYYNTVQNKSSNWGMLPYFWYFYSAIPRAMLLAVILVPFGCFNKHYRTIQKLFVVTVLYVVAYSFLPHKELRFIIYIFPVLNVVASMGIQKILHWTRNHQYMYWLTVFGVIGLITANTCGTLFFSRVSSMNYAGGEAFKLLHQINQVNKLDPYNIHIHNTAAQSGVTRFGEIFPHWRYSKNESFKFTVENGYDSAEFTHLIVEAPCTEVKRFTVQAVVKGFQRLLFEKSFPFIKIIQEPKLCILKV